MLIVQLDEPTLFVFESPLEAEREIEGIDAEREVRAAFDEQGVPYRVEISTPNVETESFFGLGKWIQSGTYTFEPSGPPSPERLADLLEENLPTVDPPEAGDTLRELLTRLRTA